MELQKYSKIALTTLCLAGAVALSACGGSGGGQTAGLSGIAGNELKNSTTAMRDAASAQPKSGSVTQSSNTTGEDVKITVDTVNVTSEYNSGRITHTVNKTSTTGRSWEITSSDNPVELELDIEAFKGVELSKKLDDNSRLYVDVYTDIGSDNDTDYMSGGVWLLVPADATSANDYEFGAFVDGNDGFDANNLQALSGKANYAGKATGVYSFDNLFSRSIGYWDADKVELTVNFDEGSIGTISGKVSEISDYYTGTEFEGDEITLESAPITGSNSGFFTGTLRGTVNQKDLTGNWGGQFFGNGDQTTDPPGSVAGTLGGAAADDSAAFVGAFGAYRLIGTSDN